MPSQPTLRTERLLIRPFRLADALAVQTLAGRREVAATTLTIPHPYEKGVAEQWIATHRRRFRERKSAIFAIVRREDMQLLGAIGLEISAPHERAEMGYWVGVPYWNQGYCTEAAREVLRFAFEQLGLNRVQAQHFSSNPASGRVLQKIGMAHEGCRRQAVKKWGRYQDLELYAILQSDYSPAV
jgi:ribosomal-protein-alanine N-acetyltransferase